MEPIQDEIIVQTWQDVAAYTQEQARDHMKKVGRAQPNLLTFALEFIEGMEDEVKELGIYTFFVVYQIFCNAYEKEIPMISEDDIEKCYESNEEFIENLNKAHEKIAERATKVHISSQPAVIKYLVDTLIEESPNEDERSLTEDEIGRLFIILKTVIDALNKNTPAQAIG